jgi:hypothetical protein
VCVCVCVCCRSLGTNNESVLTRVVSFLVAKILGKSNRRCRLRKQKEHPQRTNDDTRRRTPHATTGTTNLRSSSCDSKRYTRVLAFRNRHSSKPNFSRSVALWRVFSSAHVYAEGMSRSRGRARCRSAGSIGTKELLAGTKELPLGLHDLDEKAINY